jgi:hypothetical protein
MKTITALLAALLAAALLVACGSPDNSSEAGGGSGDAGSSAPGNEPEDPDSPTSDDPYSRDKDCGDVTGGQGDDPDEPVMQEPCPNQTPPGGAKFELVVPYEGPVEGVRAIPWERSRASGSDDRTFLLIYWSGVEPCNVLDRVEIKEAADKVVATIYEGAAADQQNVACIEIAVQKAVEITLDEPLGERQLVNGANEAG